MSIISELSPRPSALKLNRFSLLILGIVIIFFFDPCLERYREEFNSDPYGLMHQFSRRLFGVVRLTYDKYSTKAYLAEGAVEPCISA